MLAEIHGPCDDGAATADVAQIAVDRVGGTLLRLPCPAGETLLDRFIAAEECPLHETLLPTDRPIHILIGDKGLGGSIGDQIMLAQKMVLSGWTVHMVDHHPGNTELVETLRGLPGTRVTYSKGGPRSAALLACEHFGVPETPFLSLISAGDTFTWDKWTFVQNKTMQFLVQADRRGDTRDGITWEALGKVTTDAAMAEIMDSQIGWFRETAADLLSAITVRDAMWKPAADLDAIPICIGVVKDYSLVSLLQVALKARGGPQTHMLTISGSKVSVRKLCPEATSCKVLAELNGGGGYPVAAGFSPCHVTQFGEAVVDVDFTSEPYAIEF